MDRGDALKSYEDFLSLHTPYSLDSLVPHIENHFYRITLVNKDMTERVTIDSNLDFHNLTNGKKISMHDLGIIEWKRDGRKTNSPLADILKDLRIHPSGFSKYCIGMAVTTPGLKQNRLKPRLRKLNLI